MERHNYNGMKLAEYLHAHPDIARVYYPGLEDFPGHEIAKKQMTGFSGLISFEHKGGYEAGKELLRHFEVITLAVSLGTIDSLIQHPASMTHSHVPKELMKKQGLTESMIRISVGCEDIEDLIADVEQALARTKAAVGV